MSDNTEDDNDWDDKSDLTRLEDLSEFLHQDDPEVEAKLKAAADDEDDASFSSEDETLPGIPTPDLNSEEEAPNAMSLDDLEDSPEEDFGEDQEESSFASEDDTSFGDDDQSFGDDDQSFGEDEQSFGEEDQSFNEDEQSFGEEEDSQFDNDEEEPAFGENDQSFGEEDSQFDNDEEESSFDEGGQSFGEEDSQLDNEGEESAFGQDDQSFNEGEQSFGEEEDSNFDENNVSEEDSSFGGDEADENLDSAGPDNFQLPDPEELEKNYSQEDQTPDSPHISAAPEGQGTHTYSERENFQDLRDFGNAITYGVVKTGGNPPFSLILRNIKTLEDAEDIKIIMNEHGLVNPENEETIDQGLEQGSLLISQISEYSAIYLAHKMRRFDVELRIGLSDQLHPSKSYSREGRGLVSKYNLSQNKMETLETENHSIEIEDIKLATTPTLDGYVIRHYLQVITSHSLVEEDELRRLHQISNSGEDFDSQDEVELDNILDQFPKDELDEDMEPFDLGLNEVYRELVEDLRNQAYKLEANAVVGINFNITPMAFQKDSSKVHYKITCSGNAVWVVDHQ